MVVSIEQAAETLGCSRRQIFKLLNDGVLERAPRLGRRLRIYTASVERALQPPKTQGRKRRRPSRAGWEISDVRDLLR